LEDEKMKISHKFLLGNLRGRDHLGHLGIDEGIIRNRV
jgi:hypothetical protein